MSSNMLMPFYNRRLTNFVDDVEQQWHKLVDNFFNPSNVCDLKNKLKTNSGYPRLDVFTTSDHYVVQASVPGVNPDDVTVEVYTENEVRYVRISGHMAQEYTSEDEDATFRVKELKRGSFVRVHSLPTDVEGDPEAKVKDGIVTLKWKLPKSIEKSKEVKRITLKKE